MLEFQAKKDKASLQPSMCIDKHKTTRSIDNTRHMFAWLNTAGRSTCSASLAASRHAAASSSQSTWSIRMTYNSHDWLVSKWFEEFQHPA